MSFDEFKAVLVAMGIPEEDVVPEAGREEAGLDSLAIVELTLVLRQRYGVVVTEEEVHDAETVADVLALVETRRAAS